ncbi:hypothetical protein KBC04_02610 [Candidatus Babeliales bacterium]|nr:hypothetical protein [Candidatus Babeliales bacterium]MBP9844056.1 hypothetical protein [Candidatus Babeliales bacterium]
MKLRAIFFSIILGFIYQQNLEAMSKIDLDRLASSLTRITVTYDHALTSAMKEQAIKEGMQETGLSREDVLDLFQTAITQAVEAPMVIHAPTTESCCASCDLHAIIDEINRQVAANRNLIIEASSLNRNTKLILGITQSKQKRSKK